MPKIGETVSLSSLNKVAVGQTVPLSSLQPQAVTQTPTTSPSDSIWQKLASGASAVTDALGLHGAVDTLGTNLANIGNVLDPRTSIDQKVAQSKALPQTSLKQNVGTGLALGSTLAGLAAPGASSLAGAAAQFGGLAAAQGGGASLAEGDSLGSAAKSAAISGTIGAATGATFNLIGKALAKAGPAALSFTSGVPTDAIKQAADNPSVSKQGLGTTVENIRHQAVGSLQTLYGDLGKEFDAGLTHIGENVPISPKALAIPQTVLTQAQDIAGQFKIATKATKQGLVADFSKSAIVKGGEETAVQKTLDTLSSWNDFSPRGMQDLSARIGALRNFESGAETRSSAVVGKIYNAVNDAIKQTYPELASLRTQFAQNKNVLDEISNVLSASKDSPVSVQSSITRLSNIFKTDREQYVNIIKQLGDRSGIDYLSLLSGTEFQKVLPGFIRGVGGGSAVSVGASVLNPYLLLLAPLFSPRVAGVISRNAPAIAKTTTPIIRAAAIQSIPQLSKTQASQ